MIASVSLAWPPKEDRERAARSFKAAVEQFEAAVEAATSQHHPAEHAGSEEDQGQSVGEAQTPGAHAVGVNVNVAQLWKDTVQNGAPQEVRANAWLTLAWARRCIRREEPRLFWAAMAAGVFVGSAWVYDLARSLAELLLT